MSEHRGDWGQGATQVSSQHAPYVVQRLPSHVQLLEVLALSFARVIHCKYLEKTYAVSLFVKTGGSKSVKNWTQTNHEGSFDLGRSQGFRGVRWDLRSLVAA